jgi:hypothetical protein
MRVVELNKERYYEWRMQWDCSVLVSSQASLGLGTLHGIKSECYHGMNRTPGHDFHQFPLPSGSFDSKHAIVCDCQCKTKRGRFSLPSSFPVPPHWPWSLLEAAALLNLSQLFLLFCG